jgi:hypothetical protein
MCDSNVGVAKRIDVERISKEVADLVKHLDKEVKVEIKVSDVRKIQEKLKKIIED